MNVEPMLLTSVIFGFSGGLTCFFMSASQSVITWNWCFLMASILS